MTLEDAVAEDIAFLIKAYHHLEVTTETVVVASLDSGADLVALGIIGDIALAAVDFLGFKFIERRQNGLDSSLHLGFLCLGDGFLGDSIDGGERSGGHQSNGCQGQEHIN